MAPTPRKKGVRNASETWLPNDTKLKRTMKKSKFKTMLLEYTVSMFSGYMGPRASKNAFTAYSAIAGTKIKIAGRAVLVRFCMGILVTLSLSKKKAPIGLKIFFSS